MTEFVVSNSNGGMWYVMMCKTNPVVQLPLIMFVCTFKYFSSIIDVFFFFL